MKWWRCQKISRVPGVKKSRIGHQSGNEIVEVEYDPAQTNLTELIGALKM